MDIEEGEIIISDVSSDDSNDHQPQSWNKDKFHVEFDSFRYQSTSRCNTITSSTRSKDQHDCNETSFCRKTFSWRNCLAKDSSGQRNRSRNKSIRSEPFSPDSASIMQNQRNRIRRQRYNEHLDHSQIHESQRSKKRKRKGRSETSHPSRHKPERTLRQLINHCENRSVLINEMIQLSRTPPSATVTQENPSLMQKLITSGLAKPPVRSEASSDVGIITSGASSDVGIITSGLAIPPIRSEASSDVGIILSNSESETCVKKEQISIIDIENNDDSYDSEIEVIIPPKKVPPLVTLDSDGEEVEQPRKGSTLGTLALETLVHDPQHTSGNVAKTLSKINNNPTLDHSKTTNENKSDGMKLNNEHSARNSPILKTTEFVNDSSDSLSSELGDVLPYSPSSPSSCNSNDVNLTKDPSSQSPASIGINTSQPSQFECDELPYSPSSPSSCNSNDVNLTKDPNSQSPASIGINTSQHSQFEENSCKDFSTVSNEEISSEIWLDLNEQQTSGNQDEINSLTSLQTDLPRKNPNEGYVNMKSTNNEKPSFDSENSLSALVENFIMCSKSFTEDVNTKKQQLGLDEKIQSCSQTICENESDTNCQRKFDELSNYEDVSKTGNVENKQLLLKAVVGQHSETEGSATNTNQTNYNHCDNAHNYDSFNLNGHHLSTSEKMSSDDREPYSSSSSDNCNKIIQNDFRFTQDLNSNHPCFIISKQQSDIEKRAESTKDDFTKSTPLDLNQVQRHTVLETKSTNTEVNNSIDSATKAVNKKPELNSEKENVVLSYENSLSLRKECNNENTGMSDDEEEDNVSQLRMIALQTKGKAIYKESKFAECIEKGISQLAVNQNYDNVAEPNISECTPQNDDDDDVLQLRVAALKSAVMKKYGERKRRGLLVKKRKRAASGLADDIFDSSESNLTLEQDNSSPLSPAKSSKSLQGEEDMELAESDFGEDIIEEIGAGSVEEQPKPSDPVCSSSCIVSDPSAKTYEIPSTIHANSRNISLYVPPQPLPPGVDGDCPELISQTIFTSVLAPPPPPPPALVFSPILPPPPPPPFPSSSLESSPLFQQPPLFSNHTNSGPSVVSLDKICPQTESASISNFKILDPSYESLKNNSITDGEPISNDQLVVCEKSKKLETTKSQVRGNLITVPVMKSMLKPVLTKNQLKKRKRKRNKSVKVLTEPESSLLCITKPPGKTSLKLGGSMNFKTVKPTITQSEYGINYENNPEISCTSYGDITPVMLCHTKPHLDSWKDADNYRECEDIWQKQDLPCGMSPPKSNLCEETSIVEDEIDLSEMIVLDEVGMSPEHKSNKNEGSWDYSSPQEEDEDENTLRIRALTSLSPKPVVKKQTSTSEVSCPRPHIEPETYPKSWETYDPGTNEHNSRRGLVSSRIKAREVHNQRTVVGINTSKYRLTRTTSNEQRRSVVHGRESLKVVIPTNSPPHNQPSEPTLPVVKRLVINVDKDSDSEEECEWTRKIRIQDTNSTLPPGPVVDHELERSIDELLMRARKSVDSNSSPKQNQGGNATLEPEIWKTSESDFSLQDTPLKLLPKEKQEEYKRLKAILERKERERLQMKKISFVKIPEKSKPLLQHVLINENNKQNQKDQCSHQDDESHGDKRRKHDQCMDYGVVRNMNSTEEKHCNVKETSSRTVQGPAKSYRQRNFGPDSSGKGNCPRKVIYNEPNKVNVNSAQTSSVSSYKCSNDQGLQSKVSKSTNENVRLAKTNTFKNSETNLNSQRKHQAASQLKSVGSRCKQSSTVSSANTMKQMQENPGCNLQQRTTMLSVKCLQKDLESNTEYTSGNKLETEKENSPNRSVMAQSNSKEEIHPSALELPQILTAKADSPSLEQAWSHCLPDAKEEGREREEHECSPTVITKNEATTNVTLNDKISGKDDKASNYCEETYDNENRVNNFQPEMISLDMDDVRCLMDEGGKRSPLEEEGTVLRISTSSLCSEMKAPINNDEHSDSNKYNGATSLEGEIRKSDILDNLDAAHQELLQEKCPREELAAKKSDLLSERFGLLDDLSEMAESLDDLDSHQGRLEQAAVEISALRRALRAAEDSLREQVSVAQGLERRLRDTHTAVSARYTNIAHLEMTLHHASFEIPTTAQKLMSKKVKQVKEKIDKVKGKRSIINCLINNPDTTKEDLTEMHASLLMKNTEDPGPDEAEVINDLWLQDPKTSRLEDFSVKNISAGCDSKTDTETQTLTSSAEGCDTSDCQVLDHLKPCKDDQQKSLQTLDPVESSSGKTSATPYSGGEITCLQTTDATTKKSELETSKSLHSDSNSSVIKSVQLSKPHLESRSVIEEISSTLKNLSRQAEETQVKSSESPKEVFCKEPCASKRSFNEVCDVFETLAKKPNLIGSANASSEIEDNVIDNRRNLAANECVGTGNSEKQLGFPCKSGTSKTSKSKFQYKSILQYRGPSARVDRSPSGQAILCPYDLTGRCQDKECKFQHFN